MASNLRVDTILPSSGTTLGIGTASGTINFLGNSNLTTTGDVTVGGNLGVGGTLTYEDVTNIDSVGVITARSTVSIADSIVHTGDTNTSLRFPAADTITAETGGSERLRITSDGKIGINNNNPIHAVHIKSVMASSPSYIHMTSTGSNVNGGGGGIAFDTSAANTDETKFIATIAGIRNADGNGSNDLVFSTTKMAVNGGAPTEKLRITSDGYVTKPNQPVFDVCGASGNPSGAGYITFTTVKVNIGSHYSTGTGKFIAPVAGTYFFSFGCIKSGNSSLARLYLYKNGSSANGRQLRMPTGGDGYGENGAKTNIVTLAANDEIQVYMSEGTIHGGTAYLYFNGYLIG